MKLKKYLSLFLLLIILFLLLILPAKIIKIKIIECESQYGPCPEELIAKLNSLQASSLEVFTKKVKAYLKTSLLVSEYSFQFKFPDQAKIDVILKKGIFALQKTGQNDYALADKTGLILERRNATNLPVLQVAEELPPVGAQVTDSLLFALKITYEMYTFYQVRSAKIVENKLVFVLAGQPTIIFPLEGEKDVLMGSLKLLISRLNKIKEDSKIVSVSEIDLRFKNPVVR